VVGFPLAAGSVDSGFSLTIVLAVASALTVLLAIVFVSGRRLETSRAIRVHLPLELAWAAVCDFGSLHAHHARGRPLLRIESSRLLQGDGTTPRSVWIQRGHWGNEPYWAEIEMAAFEPPHRLAVRLRRDAFGTERGLLSHRCELRLHRHDDRETRIVLAISARFAGLRLPCLFRIAPDRLRSRLLDLGMRSVKHAVGAAEMTIVPAPRDAASAGGPPAPDFLDAPPPSPTPPMGDRV
jgi:hypothetical protein